MNITVNIDDTQMSKLINDGINALDTELFILAARATRVRDMGAPYLERYINAGYSTYPTAEKAEEGRQAGDAHDDPGLTKVVGFRVKAFLPKKKKARARR